MTKKNPVKILYSVHFLLIFLMISSKAIGGLLVINKTNIELKATGTSESMALGECPAQTSTASFTVKKNGGTSYFEWDKRRKDERCLFPPFFQFRNISVYRSENNDEIISASAEASHGFLLAHGKLIGKFPQTKTVNINGKKIELTIDANCFKSKHTNCKLILRQS